MLWPRLAGSWPGVTFTGAPLKLPATQFGLGFGTGAHAPDEYMLVESTNPKVAGLDGAVQVVRGSVLRVGVIADQSFAAAAFARTASLAFCWATVKG